MQNLESARRIVEQYNLDLTLHGDDGIAPGLWQRTIVAQRCNLVDWLRFQLNGPFWAAAGVDQSAAPDVYRTPWTAFDDNVEFLNGSPRPLTEAELTFDILRAGAAHVGETPILLVNEPIFITDGPNRHLRYSVHDPRWAYDDYRTQLVEMAEARGWDLLDAWDAIPRTEFTNAHVHLTPHGTQLFSESVGPAIVALEIEERLAVETSVCK